jgi:hypothetical protein
VLLYAVCVLAKAKKNAAGMLCLRGKRQLLTESRFWYCVLAFVAFCEVLMFASAASGTAAKGYEMYGWQFFCQR